MSQITSHILDTTKGKPAQGVLILLFQQHNNDWKEVGRSTTNIDGRVTDLLDKNTILSVGIYKLKFETKSYYDQQSIKSFYPFVEIVFEIGREEHYHVPLLLNPFGYSTYRGS
jgi:5-hydroxyisourate hydrolase